MLPIINGYECIDLLIVGAALPDGVLQKTAVQLDPTAGGVHGYAPCFEIEKVLSLGGMFYKPGKSRGFLTLHEVFYERKMNRIITRDSTPLHVAVEFADPWRCDYEKTHPVDIDLCIDLRRWRGNDPISLPGSRLKDGRPDR